MKKIFSAILIFFVAIFVLNLIGGNSNESNTNDIESRIYGDTFYDIAYSFSKPDGLRCRAYYYLLFNESDNKVIKCIHLSAGSGKTTISRGTFEGTIGENIVVSIGSKSTVYSFTDSSKTLQSEDGKQVYSLTDVSSAISKLNLWD